MSRLTGTYRRAAVLAMLACGLMLAVASPAFGAKGVSGFFGSPGGSSNVGGHFGNPRGVAINQSTGDVYVVDGSNNRVEQFTASGSFIRAWGQDVIVNPASGPAPPNSNGTGFEVCDVTAGNAPSDCKAGITGSQTGGALSTAQGIAVNQATGEVFVSSQTFLRVEVYSASGQWQRAWGRDVVVGGSTGAEVCTVAANCKTGTSGALGGEFASTFSGQLAVAPAAAPNAGNVVVADTGNRRVQEFTAAGTFVRAFGFDVASAGPGNTGTGFEVCEAAGPDTCKIGVGGAAVGQFGGTSATTNTPNRVAVDAAGAIYTVESASNFRVQKFSVQAGPPSLLPALFASGPGEPLLGSAPTTNTPTDIAVGPANQVFVTRSYPAGSGTPSAAVAERRVLELVPAGTLVDTHLAGATINASATSGGLAAHTSSGRLYLSSTLFGNPPSAFHRVYVLDDAVAPTATILSPTAVGARGATFNGLVNSGGALTGYRFEYSANGTDWDVYPPDYTDVGSAVTDTPVSSAIAGVLEPNTLYQVRLVAKTAFGPTTVLSATTTFTTGPAPPTVGPVTSADAQTTTAALYGRVTPNGQPTSWRFEYGTTPGYGNSAPSPDGSLPAAGTSTKVDAPLTGLQPSTTYHYRLVATNATGTDAGEDHTFTTDNAGAGACANEQFRTGPSAKLPGCRAYEQVSPVDKNGGDIIWQGTSAGTNPPGARPVAESGERAIFASGTEFGDAISGGTSQDTNYIAERSADGWTTRTMFPRIVPAAAGTRVLPSDPDLDFSLIGATGEFQLDPPHPTSDVFNAYLRDNTTGVVSPTFGGITEALNPFNFPVVTPDMDHLVFATGSQLTADPVSNSFNWKVYEWTGGQLRLVSVLPNGTPALDAKPGGGGDLFEFRYSTIGALSNDGRHIFFGAGTGDTGDRELYRRTDGSSTVAASPSKRSTVDPAGSRSKIFRFATGDGSRVVFTTPEHLTDDANAGPSRLGEDLYRYDVEADELINISATPGDNGAQVEGVLGASDTADRIYYAAFGQVVPGEGSASGTEPNLYLWEDDGTPDGTTRFIATLSSADSTNWVAQDGTWTARTTDDGRVLVFESEVDIRDEQDNDVQQVYRYDADAAGGTGELDCVSCSDTPLGPASIAPMSFGESAQKWELTRALSADGSRVFFNTQDALATRDSNGKLDPYMWEDGEVSLLSSGTSSQDSYFYNASASGDDVFILTDDRLVSQDDDDLLDLYDARVGGGFPSPAPPDCEGEGCQGPASSAPPVDGVGSEGLHGRGNVPSRLEALLSIVRPSHAQLRRLARGKRIGVRVRVGRSGFVRAVLRGRIANRRRVLASGSARSRAAGVVTVKLRLSRAARRELRRTSALRMSLGVTAPDARPRSLSLRLERVR